VDHEPNLERDLIRRMLAGDERAFTAFFESYFPRVYRFALPRLGGDGDATRDVVQSTLTRAMRGLAGFRGEAALFSWVCQICRREVAEYLRTNKRRHECVVLLEDDPELRAALMSIEAPAEHEPANRHGDAETRRIVRSILDRLPSHYGDVLEWKYVEGRSVAEIAQRLGVGQIAAQSLLARARVSFRQAVETVFGAEMREVLADLGLAR
jgi:RNA polymerase sigma-70 factor (ECF subfamily)